MLVARYNKFVRETDNSKPFPAEKRKEIATYGLVGEIGSLLSAVKKEILKEEGVSDALAAQAEVAEELGDIIWYCFLLAQIENENAPVDILALDIECLKKEHEENSPRTRTIHQMLAPDIPKAFLDSADKFFKKKARQFGDYQKLAYLTARTKDRELLTVCLSVLWQLGAELMRGKLPPIERELNKKVVDRNVNQVLGEIAWHLSAIASLYNLPLDDVVDQNEKKIRFRRPDGSPTELHDHKCPDREQFSRHFEVKFLTIGKGRSRMYLDGRPLGDDLTDNAHDPDGYRFHDIMHLANIAHLGWSPVIRDLLKLKRKSDPLIDEVEDGARARIVEEAVVKFIHSEATRRAKVTQPDKDAIDQILFSNKDEITFSFLKIIRNLVDGLEVSKNTYWEWEKAILDGYRIFHELKFEQQGTVTIDMNDRSIEFRPDVHIDLKGAIVGIGSHAISLDDLDQNKIIGIDRELNAFERGQTGGVDKELKSAKILAAKRAVFDSMGIETIQQEDYQDIEIRLLESNKVSVKAKGNMQTALWNQNIIAFKTTIIVNQRSVYCTALAVADPTDIAS